MSYKPGDLTDPDRRHHTHTILDDKSSVHLPELNGLYVEKPQNLQIFDAGADISDRNLCCEHEQKSPNDNSNIELIEQLPHIERIIMRQEVSEKPNANNTIPLIPAYCNFQAARKMAQENLEHQPLPDSIMDRTFLRMQAQGLPNPELSLNVEPTATGLQDLIQSNKQEFHEMSILFFFFFRCGCSYACVGSNSLHETKSVSPENVRCGSATDKFAHRHGSWIMSTNRQQSQIENRTDGIGDLLGLYSVE